MSPLFFRPPPYGEIESRCYDALHAAGFDLRTRHGIITGGRGSYRRAERGAYRTRSHRSYRALWAQVVTDRMERDY